MKAVSDCASLDRLVLDTFFPQKASLCFLPAGRMCMRPGLLRAASASEILPFAKWFVRRVALAGRALAWLALYKRPKFLVSNTGLRQSATSRNTRHVAEENKFPIYVGMFLSPAIL
ncbi:hypothetical protein DPMN_151019 [Dreissena polymorpha]|uniref:Uncharacterized protein n=1 Tax=Dreissena polymorpha TaxID=45954 RepID=A0A9D4FEH5_DREPO|nr:hypothetical protein DPMN_151019 [Dreissena polymorpha]